MAKLAPERVIETLRAHLSSVSHLKGAEIYLVSDEVTSLLVEGDFVLRNAFFTRQEVAVRFFSEESHSFGVCSDFDSDSINQFFKELQSRSDMTLPGSMLISPIEFDGEFKKDSAQIKVVDQTFANTPVSEKIQRLLNLVHSFTKTDSRIQKTSRVQYKETLRTEWLWTTGSAKVLKRQLTRGDILSRLVAHENSSVSVAETRFSETHFLSFDWSLISKVSVAKVLRKLSGRDISSGAYPVLLLPTASREWIKWLFQFVSARSSGNSKNPLATKFGKRVTHSDFRLYDDPHFTKRPGTVLWDAEGSVTGVHDYFSQGIFQTWATDRKSAVELKIRNTANSRRASADHLPEIDFHNLVLEPGLKDSVDMLKQLGQGIRISELLPLTDPRQNPDEVLLRCWGTWMENSKEVYNLKPFYIVDSVDSQLEKVRHIGRDLLWTGRVASPSLLFENVKVMGSI
jgi:predicted Zn-dependent protease